ncbi:GMC oxidoreductase [Xylariales sp. PMI_506]|nr:GMC oxidoreductase [Xylariales sp. PMI_506]
MRYSLFQLATWANWSGLALCTAQYDYIIAGAGTAGLVVANRLSANPSTNVLVIEPGTDQRGNPNVTSVLGFLTAFNTSIDWQYDIVPQASLAGRNMQYHAGKAIGGTSTINGMTYIRGDSAEVDAWELLGNDGWNWDSLWPHYKAVESFEVPTKAQIADGGASYNPSFHGESGLLKTGYPWEVVNGSFHDIVQDTWATLGYPLNPDPNGGDVRGFAVFPMTADRNRDIREDAATAFLWPFVNRKNLKVIQGTVRNIVWKTGASTLTAQGVEYLDPTGKVVSVSAKKEVILSAGAIRSPLILERSGVGNQAILESLGIDTVLNLPGVGENLIDQPIGSLVYSINSTSLPNTLQPYAEFATAEDVFGDETSALAASTEASLAAWADQVAAANNNATNATALAKIFAIQHDLIFNKNVTVGELLTSTTVGIPIGDDLNGWVVNTGWPLLPFSRGSVHLPSADGIDNPVIDPKYMLVDFDTTITVALGKLLQNFFYTEPISSLVTGYISPGDAILPHGSPDEVWEALLIEGVSPNHHALGTAAMMSQELGGVVDPQLKVYGTSNVRVIDASVIPMQISGHLTATIYAVADRASSIILGEL